MEKTQEDTSKKDLIIPHESETTRFQEINTKNKTQDSSPQEDLSIEIETRKGLDLTRIEEIRTQLNSNENEKSSTESQAPDTKEITPINNENQGFLHSLKLKLSKFKFWDNPSQTEIDIDHTDESNKTTNGISRRAFLKMIAKGTAVGIAAETLGVAGYTARRPLQRKFKELLNAEQLDAQIEEKENYVLRQYNIDVTFAPTLNDYYDCTKEELSPAQKSEALDYIIRELAMYPNILFVSLNQFSKNRRLNEIQVINAYTQSDGKTGKRNVGGTTDEQTNRIVLQFNPGLRDWNWDSIERALGRDEEKQLPKAIHHELYHKLLDERNINSDIDWEELSPDKNKAYISLDIMYNNKQTLRRKAGFVSTYAQANVQEDKAETHRFLMKHPLILKQACKKDEVIAKKTQFIKRQLYSLSLGVIDDEYWQALEKNELTPELAEEFFLKKELEILQMSPEQFRDKAQDMFQEDPEKLDEMIKNFTKLKEKLLNKG